MDIQRWLDQTVLPERPASPPVVRIEAPIALPKKPEQAHKKKRRRRHSTSDSSLLEVPPPRKKTPPITREADIDQSADDSAYSDASHPTSRSGSSTSSLYARKPRRKTRPERYEPTLKDVKGRGRHIHRHRKGESKKTQRKPRRRKVDKPGSGIVQSFYAKNVPRDRLTLRPREKLGIFSKGRASSPVKGRGLPDLVFSEMKFLQKNKNQPETEPKSGLSKKKRKKDQAHAKEGEISAYFTSVRPALAEKDVNIQAKEGSRRKGLRGADRREPERSSVVDNAIPTVELPDKASYLGFGSRGPRHESQSYISWSESIRAPSGTPAGQRAGSTVNVGQLDLAHGGRERGNTEGGQALHPRPARPTVTGPITEGSGGRFQVSSLAPANDRVSRSHSLPQHTSSPRRVNLVDRAAKRRPTLESAASPSSMPPFIPIRADVRREQRGPAQTASASGLRHSSLSSGDPTLAHKGDCPHSEARCALADDDPQTSSSLGRILKDCNTAFDERRRAAVSYGTNAVRAEVSEIPIQERTRTDRRPYPTIRRMPTVRFSGVEICNPRLSNFSGRSIYEQQEQRQYVTQQPSNDDYNILQEPYPTDGEALEGEEEDFDGDEWEALPEAASYGELEPSVGELMEQYGINDGQESIEQRNSVVANSGFWATCHARQRKST